MRCAAELQQKLAFLHQDYYHHGIIPLILCYVIHTTDANASPPSSFISLLSMLRYFKVEVVLNDCEITTDEPFYYYYICNENSCKRLLHLIASDSSIETSFDLLLLPKQRK